METWIYTEREGERRTFRVSAGDDVLDLVPPASLILIDEAHGRHFTFSFRGRFTADVTSSESRGAPSQRPAAEE